MKMLSSKEIDEIATAAAQANLTPQIAQRAFSVPTVDSEGQDALLLTIIIAPEAVDHIAGKALLQNLIDTQRRLQTAGEERHAILSYATEQELSDAGHQP